MRMYISDLNDPEVLYKHVSKVCNVQWFDDKCQPLSDELSALADRYTEYALMCRAGGEKPMAYTDWVDEFSKIYLEHVRTTPNPLSPSTFQRMQEVNKENPTNDQLQQEIIRLNALVDKLTAQRDRAIHFESEAEKETNRLGQELWKVKDDCKEAVSNVQRLTAVNCSLNEEISTCCHKQSEVETATSEGYSYEELCSIRTELTNENEELIKEIELLKSDSGQRKTPANQPLYPHYYRDVSQLTHIDVYWVLQAWSVVNPSIQHAVKKLLAAGQRGAKDTLQDLNEARNSISRAIELEETK